MFPYWVMFAIFAIASLNYKLRPREDTEAKPLFIAAAVGLILFIGLRYQVGADWIAYEDMFALTTYLSTADVLAYGDRGYMAVNVVAHAMGTDIWLVNLICAAIFVWGLATFAKEQPNPWLAFVVAIPYLAIVVAMGYTRQGVAIGLIMASIGPFQRKQYIRCSILFFFAAMFHATSVIVLPLIIFSVVRYKFVIYLIGAAATGLIFTFFISAILDRFVAGYLTTAMKSDGAGVRVAMNVVPAVLFLFFQRRFVLSEQERKLWRNIAVAALALVPALILVRSSTAVDRMALYLMPIQIFVLGRLPLAFPNLGQANVQLTFFVICYSAIIEAVWLNFASYSIKWLPYQIYPFFSGT